MIRRDNPDFICKLTLFTVMMEGYAVVKMLRNVAFPLFLGLVYLAQIKFPVVLQTGALWSEHPRWWQFFTNGFLSGNWIHLTFNMCAIWVICSQFATQIRLYFLILCFVLFSAASSFLFYKFFMPQNAWLIGASGGVYSLVGFLCWFQRHHRVCFMGLKKFSMPFFIAILMLLFLEFLTAVFWIKVLAWQVHVIAFLLSISVAMLLNAAYAVLHKLAEQNLRFQKGALLMQKIKEAVTRKNLEEAVCR